MADVEQGEVTELLDVVELTLRVLKSRPEGIVQQRKSQFELFTIQPSKKSHKSVVNAYDFYIRLTSFPFISGRSTSHSSRRTAKSESPTTMARPRLHTRVIA
jgi:hypothetical protein